MSGIILCRSEYSKVPYYIEGADINVYSIEEISYFLYHDIYLVGADFFCEDLFVFIEKNIKEPELAQRLRTLKERRAELSELVLTVLGYVDFYSEKEISQIRELLERLDTQNPLERLKARADSYLQNGRYVRALSCYENILSAGTDKEQDRIFIGNVWHNMGTAYAKMFSFDAAQSCFDAAYKMNENEQSKDSALKARELLEKEPEEKDGDAVRSYPGGNTQLITKWKNEYLGYIR